MDLLRRRMAAWALALAAVFAVTGCGERWTGEGPPAETGDEENGENGEGENGEDGEDDEDDEG